MNIVRDMEEKFGSKNLII